MPGPRRGPLSQLPSEPLYLEGLKPNQVGEIMCLRGSCQGHRCRFDQPAMGLFGLRVVSGPSRAANHRSHRNTANAETVVCRARFKGFTFMCMHAMRRPCHDLANIGRSHHIYRIHMSIPESAASDRMRLVKSAYIVLTGQPQHVINCTR